MESAIVIRFVGIDYWSRPVFKMEGATRYFGSLDILFDGNATEDEVLTKVQVKDICYFGREFDCEPNGGVLSMLPIIIKRRDEA